MDLLLHIGTEKTGSSFLQVLCARARSALVGQGVAFPTGTAHDERCMARGEISAGNGRRLVRLLEDGDWPGISRELGTIHARAVGQDCRMVLVSCELLLAPLGVPGTLQRLVRAVSESGFDSLRLLVILRDPAGQILSLYKHRAKRGTAGTIEEWVQTGYDLPQTLAGLRQGAAGQGIELTARAYGRGAGVLERVFFTDWLGVPPPQVQVAATVNPSLTLSELALLRLMAGERPDMVGPLYDHLLRLDPGAKLQGAALEAHAATIAAATAAAHRSEWEAWNALLPEGEALTIPEAPDTIIPSAPQELGFSEAQMAALARFLATSATPGFVAWRFWANHLRPVLGRMKRAVVGSDLT